MLTVDKFVKNRSLRIGITSLLSNVTTKPGSHNGGWARLLSASLRSSGFTQVAVMGPDSDQRPWDEQYDVVLLICGTQPNSSVNLFGGLSFEVFRRLNRLAEFSGTLMSWSYPPQSLVKALKGRESTKTCCAEFKSLTDKSQFLEAVDDEQLRQAVVFEHPVLTDRLLVSDSHGPAVWTPDYMIDRVDGRTLHGLLRSDLLVDLARNSWLRGIAVQASSIDIRHHLMRRPDPKQAVMDLAERLVQQLEEWGDREVRVHATMGIEHPSRRMSTSGFYNGTPFHGSWEERNDLRNWFNVAMSNACATARSFGKDWQFIDYPRDFFYTEKDEEVASGDHRVGELRQSIMEPTRGVHVSPEHYRWNLDNDESRWEY